MNSQFSVVMVMWSLHYVFIAHGQDCPSKQEMQNSLRQLDKLLSAQEASYLQNLRSLRKRLSALQNSSTLIARHDTQAHNATCPKPEVLANGRRLGRVFGVGHEVHFVCKAGYELMGPQTRVCLASRKWSGKHPTCRVFNTLINTPAAIPTPSYLSSMSSSTSLSMSSSTSSPSSQSSTSSTSSPSSAPLSDFVRPSRCTQFQGSSHCTCDPGFTISSRDNNVCTDMDECQLFPLAQPGRLCMHACVNTPGSYSCVCPRGYNLTRDNRSCKDLDECENGHHNCTQEQECVNTYGGFQCVHVECPPIQNATYIKTSSMRCERNPCVVGDLACSQAPNSVSFQFLPVVSNMPAPRVLFRVSAARVLGDTLRFGLLGSTGRRHFSMQRSGRQTGTLLLVNSIHGPATLEAEIEMSELERRAVLGRYLTKSLKIFIVLGRDRAY
ncbi:fibulin-7 isoform X2 [Esox lucius]|uniref:fibulin-7 isoform X2 n=1 Tax=Esox lucius TaxID=8010 RepID=UPI001476B6DF|nr:fibulin-7 isoform X2 [Esox lucius]